MKVARNSMIQLCGLCVAFVIGWGLACKKPAPGDIEQAANVIQYMAAPRNVARSMFMAMDPTGDPSQFVNFLFSDLGSAEWPDSESYADDNPLAAEQARAIRAPLVPSNVAFVPYSVEPGKGRQVVVSADDDRRLITITGYVDPNAEPVLYREMEFRLPAVDSRRKEALEFMAQANEDARRDVGYGEIRN